MSLTPPPDYTKAILCGCIGVCAALVVTTVKTDYSAQVGDNIHKLPHGGSYKDGTKSVVYAGKLFDSSNHSSPNYSDNFWAFIFVWLLIFLIYVSLKCSKRDRSFHYHNCDFHPLQQ
ncbi:triple gene block protein 2 [Cherry robigovirus 5]|nr:triple gene block protein 2 [Cherry robigovirus 5]